ncbi:MAG: hypothetical protein K2G55_09570, partial [Lachnospiraceae bacterium]|nr:hypothetical protein [Lachnospiraceae bacterium]
AHKRDLKCTNFAPNLILGIFYNFGRNFGRNFGQNFGQEIVDIKRVLNDLKSYLKCEQLFP